MPISPTFLFTLEAIIITPICYVFSIPAQEMSQHSVVYDIECDITIEGIANDFLLGGDFICAGLNLVTHTLLLA